MRLESWWIPLHKNTIVIKLEMHIYEYMSTYHNIIIDVPLLLLIFIWQWILLPKHVVTVKVI
jgi:hypothetical protein